MLDVLIVGGGVTGCAILRTLSQYALRVALLEAGADIACGATKANSAIVHGGYAEAHTKQKGRLCYQGRRQFARLDRALGFGFAPIGSLVLAFEDGQRDALVAMMENGAKNGVDDLALLDGAQVRALEPNVNPGVRWALYCRGAGVCSPFGLAIAFAENALANGAHIHLNSRVIAISQSAEGFAVDTAAGARHTARFVVNAGGLQAADIARLAGDDSFAIHPRSGEYVLMQRGTGSLVRSVLFQMPTKMGKGILVTPTIYGNLLIGPDAIDEVDSSRDTHPERLRHILDQAMLTTDKINPRQFLRSFAGVRPVADTDDFIIGPSAVPGLIHAAGIQSPGLTASPAVAERVRDALCDAELALREKPDFDPQRRPNIPPAEDIAPAEVARRVALAEGDAGRLICRCQQVPEASVRDAAARGLPLYTVDASKRRTRAGMGFCQGAFCRPRSAQLLTRLQGIAVDDRTDAEREGLSRVNRAQLLAYLGD